jgi:hypothetical protein
MAFHSSIYLFIMHSSIYLFIIAVDGATQVAAQTGGATSNKITFPIQYSPLQSKCAAAYASIAPEITDAPAPPEAISMLAASWVVGSLHNAQNPCELPTVTGDRADEFSTWASAWNEWRYDHIHEFRELWKACSDDLQATAIVPIGSNACPDFAAKVTGDVKAEYKDDDETETVAGKKVSRRTRWLFETLLAAVTVIVGMCLVTQLFPDVCLAL